MKAGAWATALSWPSPRFLSGANPIAIFRSRTAASRASTLEFSGKTWSRIARSHAVHSKTNATLVSGQRIERTGLHDGDRILIGSTLLAFYVKDEQELSLDQQLLQMATTDGLTGLANRYYFLTVARREIERARRYQRDLSLIMLDLDHFKSINDTQGHAAGDMVLRQLARILVVTMREGDLIGRVGGEEFAILLPETALEGASATAERIRQRVSDHNFQFHGIDMHVTVSLGVAEFTYSYATREAFFEAADKALYEAKSKGRNCVCEAPKPPSTPPTSVQ